MTMFIAETAFLLLFAFVLGASLGCMVRSFFSVPHVSAPSAAKSVDAPKTATAFVESASAVEPQDGGEAEFDSGPPPLTPPETRHQVVDPEPARDVVAAAPDEQTTNDGADGQEVIEAQIERPDGSEQHVSAAAAKIAAAVVATASAAAATRSAREPEAKPSAAVAIVSEPAQDLTRIHAIDEAVANMLNELGFKRYEQVAAWTAGDVAVVGDALDGTNRLSRENWIEQAQILAGGNQTLYSRFVDAGPVGVTPESRSPQAADSASVGDHDASSGPDSDRSSNVVIWPAAAAVAGAVAAAQAVEQPRATTIDPEADDLTRVLGIDAELAERLYNLGVREYATIANWTASDVADVNQVLELRQRIERENWIEQAHILARGGETLYSQSLALSRSTGALERAPVVKVVETEPPEPPEHSTPDQTPTEEDATTTTTLQDEPRRSVDATRDVIDETPHQRIDSAETEPAGAASNVVGLRSTRQRHVEALRSVRSEALRGSNELAGATGPMVRSSRPDDLKRIRGIGVILEKKLNSMGITNYGEIANWTSADIEVVNELLSFSGRIERESWIEQARILATGSATEFADRVDRGEIDSSRDDS